MTKILVISDIHYPTRLKNLALINELEKLIENVDITICCGDYVSENIVALIESKSKKSFLVKGNMDFFEVNICQKQIVEIENFKIGIIHGDGSPIGIEKRVLRSFDSNDLDIIFFGHSHIATNKKIDNTLLINPGAYCDGRYCIVNLEKENLKYEFKKILK